LLEKHLESVIEFESYILTSLEGQGPKPVADKMGGVLFEEEDKTLWSEDVLSKLTQTRQANISAEQEEVKGFLGRVKKRALSYRLDVPVISDSNLLGIISLRRSTEPFNDLDMVASVSIAAQAMMIFKRSTRNTPMVLDGPALSPSPASSPLPTKRSGDITVTSKLSTTQSTDMEMTDQSFIDPNAQAGSGDKEEKGGKGKSAVKKTITLLSRENSDRIGREKYQTAVLEGDPFSILIIEIDGLSKLREQDGDQVAYRVFASIVRYIFSNVDKKKDTLGRYGQNGLSVLTPEIDMNAAEKFAEKIRKYVAKARFQTDLGEKSATLSIGVAAMTDETGNYNSMVKRADMALFVAKKNGRNCVKVRL